LVKLALNSDILKQETLIAGIVAIVAMAGIFLGGRKTKYAQCFGYRVVEDIEALFRISGI
jgi:hypothetical protein